MKKSAIGVHVSGSFEPEGPLEWAILTPIPPVDFEARAFRFRNRHIVRSMWDLDAPRSWCVVQGTKKHSALIETMPGSACTEIDLARELSKEWKTTVFALGFAGYADPDHGLPYITRYDEGESGLIWMASSDDEHPAPQFVAGPKGIPHEDPFRFADALGCKLRPYYDA